MQNNENQKAKVSYERNGSQIDWKVPMSLMKDKTEIDIMMENGYHPAGYGSPFNKRVEGDTCYFSCWASCD